MLIISALLLLMQGLPEYQGIARSFKQGVLISEVPRFSLQVNARTTKPLDIASHIIAVV